MHVLAYILLVKIWIFYGVSSLEMDFKYKYYTDATLVCDAKALGTPYTTFLKYWILPNGRMLEWNQKPERKYIVGAGPEFNLTVTYISDEDFGWYYCVILWDNYIYLTHSIKVGLNVNGADFEDLFESYRASAAIGAIAAASTALLFAFVCSVYWCRYSMVNRQNKPPKAHKYMNMCLTCCRKKKDDKAQDIVTQRKTEEREAIYVLDNAVKDYDDRPTSFGSVMGGGETMTLGQSLQLEIARRKMNDFDRSDVNRIPTPPPPPPLPMPKHDVFDDYDKIPQRRKYSNSATYGNQKDVTRAKQMVEGHSNWSNGYVNPGFETEMAAINPTRKLEEEQQEVDVIDSYLFQEDIQDDLII